MIYRNKPKNPLLLQILYCNKCHYTNKIDKLIEKEVLTREDFKEFNTYDNILDSARYLVFKKMWPLDDKRKKLNKIYKFLNINNRMICGCDILTEY
jgi:hypothetical protein